MADMPDNVQVKSQSHDPYRPAIVYPIFKVCFFVKELLV